MTALLFSTDRYSYLLRNGCFINSTFCLPGNDLVSYKMVDGTTILALTSANAEHHLMRLINSSAESHGVDPRFPVPMDAQNFREISSPRGMDIY